MSKSGGGKVNIPQYNEPTPYGFSTPDASVGFSNGNFNLSYSPQMQQSMDDMSAMRNAIMKSLGTTSADREASLNNWQDTFQKELLRSSQPQLEQSLFDRGLGGSNYYSGALTDLISKAGSQAVLNREQLAQQDEQSKINRLGAVAGLQNQDQQNNMGLLGLANQSFDARNSLASQRYGQTLPYLASYSQNPGYLGLGGTALGGLAGFAMGGFPGAAAGAGIGGAVGGGVDTGMGNSSYGNQFYSQVPQMMGGLNSLTPYGSLGQRTGIFGGGTSPYGGPSNSFLNNPLKLTGAYK